MDESHNLLLPARYGLADTFSQGTAKEEGDAFMLPERGAAEEELNEKTLAQGHRLTIPGISEVEEVTLTLSGRNDIWEQPNVQQLRERCKATALRKRLALRQRTRRPESQYGHPLQNTQVSGAATGGAQLAQLRPGPGAPAEDPGSAVRLLLATGRGGAGRPQSHHVTRFGTVPDLRTYSEEFRHFWLEQLAGEESLHLLASHVPSGLRKKALFQALFQYCVPIVRAGWYIKVIYLNAHKGERQQENRSRVWTRELEEHMNQLLDQLMRPAAGTAPNPAPRAAGASSGVEGSPGEAEVSDARDLAGQWKYITELAQWSHHEGLLDRRIHVEWLLTKFKENEGLLEKDELSLSALIPLLVTAVPSMVGSQRSIRQLAEICIKYLHHLHQQPRRARSVVEEREWQCHCLQNALRYLVLASPDTFVGLPPTSLGQLLDSHTPSHEPMQGRYPVSFLHLGEHMAEQVGVALGAIQARHRALQLAIQPSVLHVTPAAVMQKLDDVLLKGGNVVGADKDLFEVTGEVSSPPREVVAHVCQWALCGTYGLPIGCRGGPASSAATELDAELDPARFHSGVQLLKLRSEHLARHGQSTAQAGPNKGPSGAPPPLQQFLEDWVNTDALRGAGAAGDTEAQAAGEIRARSVARLLGALSDVGVFCPVAFLRSVLARGRLEPVMGAGPDCSRDFQRLIQHLLPPRIRCTPLAYVLEPPTPSQPQDDESVACRLCHQAPCSISQAVLQHLTVHARAVRISAGRRVGEGVICGVKRKVPSDEEGSAEPSPAAGGLEKASTAVVESEQDARREESAWGEMQPLRRAIAEALELPAWAAALGQPASVRLTQPPAEDAGRQGSVASCMANEWTEWCRQRRSSQRPSPAPLPSGTSGGDAVMGQAAPLEDGDNGRQESMPSCGGGCGDAERSLSGAQASTNPAAMDEDTQAGGGAGAPSRLGHIGRSVRQLPPKQQAWLAQWVVCAVHGHVTQASSEGPPQAVLRGSPELAWVLTGEAAAASPGAHGAGNGEATSAASNGAPGAQARRDGGVGGGWERPWGEAEGAREAARGLSGAQMRLLWLLLGECFAQPQLVRLLLWFLDSAVPSSPDTRREVLAGDAAALTALRGEDRVVAALGLVPALLSVLVQRALNVATATAAGDSNANGKEPILPPHARKVLAYARTLLWQYAALERVADWRRLIGKRWGKAVHSELNSAQQPAASAIGSADAAPLASAPSPPCRLAAMLRRAMPALATEVMEAGKPGEAWRTSAEEVAKQLAKEGGSEVDARHMVQALVESIAECILSETGAGRAHRLVELHLALLLSYTHHLVPSTKPGTSQPKAGVVGVLGSWEWSQQTLLAVALAAGGPSGSSRAAAAAAALVVLAVAEGVVGLAEAVRQLLPARASRMEPLWARLLLGRRGAQALPPEIDLAAPTWGALWRLQHVRQRPP
ncbi:hypothetical protein CYMTET_10305 [Cymbomonas tetramitiformis]|uniref:Mediator complex subunit Med12 domain-containing protein n=1 Tax=Cymbomonas tetramitiformis TaxID=36881 RepID=A0AAE0GQ10_9CHLO|nr:hypothetical protein CYMTET_10305 [Cymbomonas tetramitiformis]